MNLVARFLGRICVLLLRFAALTWRVRLDGIEKLDARLRVKQPLVAAFWHATYVPLFALLRVPGACVFTSRSFRGDVISEICRRFGFRAIELERARGSSVERMSTALAGASAAAIAVDGPLGPRHVVKRGVVAIASRTGWPILPIAVSSRPKWVFAGRWDRMEIPFPFARVEIAIGDPIDVPRMLDAEAMDWWRSRIGAALDVQTAYHLREGAACTRGTQLS